MLQEMIYERFAVLCLSSDCKNIMMYSHYADKHKGVCLEFTLPQDNMLQPAKVDYVKSFPQPIFSEEEVELYELARALITTKALMWEYEDEYRCLKPGVGHFNYPSEYLTGVIFGSKATKDTKTEIFEMARLLASRQICFYEATQSKAKFALDILPIR